nr:EOG090X0C7N [Lepidurus arcticus]
MDLPIVIALFVVALTIVVLFFLKRRKNNRRDVLLVGLVDAGKTVLFTQLAYNKSFTTQTSIKENVADFPVLNKANLKLVDIPGQERIRSKHLDQYKANARGVVFVIDAVSFFKQVRDVAEWFYTLLTDQTIASACPRVLVFCNKQDDPVAKGKSLIQSQLEKEMNVLRETRSNQLQGTSDLANNNSFLGKRGQDFQFSHLGPIKVEFVEGNVQGSQPAIQPVINWIQALA